MQVRHPIHIAAEAGNLEAITNLIKESPELLNLPDHNNQTPLMWAAAYGHEDVVKYLLRQKGLILNFATKSVRNSNGYTALHWAIENKHTAIAAALIRAGANLKAQAGSLLFQPIHIAEKKDDLETLKLLIETDRTLLNEMDAYGQTPLLWAAANGHDDVARYLLEQESINLDAATQATDEGGLDHNGKTALHWALEKKHTAIAAALIRAGANLKAQAGSMLYQPIHIAAMEGDLDTLKLLIETDRTLLNEMDKYGQTPLLLAAANGYDNIVRYLLKQKADINLDAAIQTSDEKSPDNGKTALHWAIENKHPNIAAALIRSGANLTKKSGLQLFQPIHWAAKEGDLKTLTRLIRKDKSLLNQLDCAGQTPLMLAAAAGHEEVVKYLLQFDVNLNVATQTKDERALDHNGKTALHWAIGSKHPAIAAMLIKAGANLKAQANIQLFQPIHIAAYIGDLATLKLLVEADRTLFNQLDQYGQTPLMVAAAKGHEDVVKYLLQQEGINLDATTQITNAKDDKNNGKTASDWANENSHYAIAEAITKTRYDKLYAEQEKKRTWKTALAFAVSILSGGLLAVPAYFAWRALKRDELLQKIETTPQKYQDIKTKQKSLKMPKLEDETGKPKKILVSKSAEKIVYYMDKEQARGHRFFASCYKNNKKISLTQKESSKHIARKEASVALAPLLQGRPRNR